MCNLYRLRGAIEEVADLFAAKPQHGANYGEEVYPGYPGVVIAEGRAQIMTWGFPLALTGKQGQQLKPKAINNARADKLRSAFWRSSFHARRCLIPVTAWAEAEGLPRRMNRTWYSLPGVDTFAVAGLWRPTIEWGHAYAMVMADGCVHMADVHDRMPVLLARQHWHDWLTGTPDRAIELCRTWEGKLTVDRTTAPWVRAKSLDPEVGILL